jgi:GDP-4-dehydro-6-deoxy-D-mannose reductase
MPSPEGSVEQCVVTGASGFIGQHLMAARELVHEQLGASLLPVPAEIDICNAKDVAAFIAARRPRYVIHLAAITFVPDSVADPLKTYQVNLLGTLNVLSALAASNAPARMLFASSAEVYGAVAESDLPVDETQRFAPRTPYAVSKAAAELACLQHALAGKVDVCIARPFNVIGAGQTSKFAVSSFARQVAELEVKGGGEVAVGNLDVTRDFVAVQDAVSAFVGILARGRSGEAYNICTGTETRLQHVLDVLLSLAGAPLTVRFDTSRARATEQRRVVGSCRKLDFDTGWKPTLDLASSLKEVLDFWRVSLTQARDPMSGAPA